MAHGEALRIRVIKAAVQDALSRNEAARIFRVGIASAIRWVKAFEETRRAAALPTGGVPRRGLRRNRSSTSPKPSVAGRARRSMGASEESAVAAGERRRLSRNPDQTAADAGGH